MRLLEQRSSGWLRHAHVLIFLLALSNAYHSLRTGPMVNKGIKRSSWLMHIFALLVPPTHSDAHTYTCPFARRHTIQTIRFDEGAKVEEAERAAAAAAARIVAERRFSSYSHVSNPSISCDGRVRFSLPSHNNRCTIRLRREYCSSTPSTMHVVDTTLFAF